MSRLPCSATPDSHVGRLRCDAPTGPPTAAADVSATRMLPDGLLPFDTVRIGPLLPVSGARVGQRPGGRASRPVSHLCWPLSAPRLRVAQLRTQTTGPDDFCAPSAVTARALAAPAADGPVANMLSFGNCACSTASPSLRVFCRSHVRQNLGPQLGWPCCVANGSPQRTGQATRPPHAMGAGSHSSFHRHVTWQPGWLCFRCGENIGLDTVAVPQQAGDPCRHCGTTQMWTLDR